MFSTMLKLIVVIHIFFSIVKCNEFCSKDDLLCSVTHIQDKFEIISQSFVNFSKPKSVDKLVKIYKKHLLKNVQNQPKLHIKMEKKIVNLEVCECDREILVNSNFDMQVS